MGNIQFKKDKQNHKENKKAKVVVYYPKDLKDKENKNQNLQKRLTFGY